MYNLYIGSNYDIYPLLYNIKKNTNWIYIDSLPNSDGYLEESICDSTTNKSYIENAIKEFAKCEYIIDQMLSDPEENLILFRNNNNNTIHFFYNTIFPNNLSSLQKSMINESDLIYISAFIPDICILKMCSYPLDIVISSNTYVYYRKHTGIRTDIFGHILLNNIKNIELTYIDAEMSYDFSNLEIIRKEIAELKIYHPKNVYELYQIIEKCDSKIDYSALIKDLNLK